MTTETEVATEAVLLEEVSAEAPAEKVPTQEELRESFSQFVKSIKAERFIIVAQGLSDIPGISVFSQSGNVQDSVNLLSEGIHVVLADLKKKVAEAKQNAEAETVAAPAPAEEVVAPVEAATEAQA